MKLQDILSEQLRKEPNYVTDNGELKKWVVINKAQNFDIDLIGLLFERQELKEKFFKQTKGAWVFDQNFFVQFMEQKNYLNDSYTRYKNKVGLTIGGQYLKQRNEISLVWPFKDCILEGGQSREEDKREEIFFNEILAQDEITQLLAPKVLTKTKVFDKDGAQEFQGFTRDAEINKKRGLDEDTITDNLLIQGNNLLALHSLKKDFTGKIKLIYIDPPYNTGSDSFGYNDRFNHSTWLTFMKNRLEVAKDLLKDNGSLWINADDMESHYLKILGDEVFGRDNFVANVIWEKKYTVANDAKYFSDNHDHILVFTKNLASFSLGKLPRTAKMNLAYSNPDKHPKGKWKATPLHAKSGSEKNMTASYTFRNGVIWSPPVGTYPRFSPMRLKEMDENNEIWFGIDGNAQPSRKTFLAELKNTGVTPRTIFSYQDVGHNHGAKDEVKTLFEGNVFTTPKPEGLLKQIITLGSTENDIVLDYHLGSGTTAAVAHKMGRQFIGIEQMDYIENISSARLQKVIQGEQGGISKSVNWQGGGSFTYLELKKYNQDFIDKIERAKTSSALLKIWEEMKEKSFLNYNIDIKKQEASLEDFKELELAQQKEHLCSILDKNQLYVNLSSLDDQGFACSEEEKRVSQDFYQINKEV